MRLSVPQRAQVAAELLASLDGELDSDVEAAWAEEIARRIEQIQSGRAAGRPWAEVRERIERRDR
jgi:putative addiction module component (TIGR02574 family)